jgi:uncharacterized protein YndB with AHSA1/START domain
MKIFVTILIVLAVVIVILLVIGLFTKKEYTIEKEVTINKPKQGVFSYIKLLKNQNNYSKWATMDPNMKQSFIGTDGEVGFVSAWDSEDKNVGKGEQEIKKITEGERIDYEIRFIKPFEAIAISYMTTEAISEKQTKVKWGFIGNMKYPMNLMLLFMNMEKMVGNDLNIGLTNLKGVLEKQ